MRRCGKTCLGKNAAAFFATIAVLAVIGCGDSDTRGNGGSTDLVLSAVPQELQLAPGAVGAIEFRLTDKSGRSRSANTLRFALIGNNTLDGGTVAVAGASLLAAEGSTNAAGRFVVELRAGTVGRFQVRASHSGSADKLVPVVVVRQTQVVANAVVSPNTTAVPASVEMRLYRDRDCTGITVSAPAPADRRDVQLISASARWDLPTLSTSANYALAAKGFDQSGGVVSFGCIGVNGSQLLQTAITNFVVPLLPIAVSLFPRYEASSELGFSGSTAKGAKLVASSWAALSACPNDPASRWLDCTIDALGPDGQANTPLDCVPEADEGDVGRLLAARRGVQMALSPDCRADKDPGGQPSADSEVFALFPKVPSAAFAALPVIAKAAGGLFTRLRLSSSLEISPSGRPGLWLAKHTVRSIGFPVGESFYSVQISDRPGKVSHSIFVSTNEAATQISIAKHGFALDLGDVAHSAFRTRLFADQGFAVEELDFIQQLAAQAVLIKPTSTSAGCAAMDELLCPQIGKPKGCLETACRRGLSALASTLTAGFEDLSSDDLDLILEGSAPLADRLEDGAAAGFGSLVPNREGPGLWSGELRGAAMSSPLNGLWVAVKQVSP